MTSLRSTIAAIALALAGIATNACEKKQQPPTPAKPAPAQNPAPPAPLLPQGLGTLGEADAAIKVLRAGGLVLAIRHAKTNHDVQDKQGTDFADCSKQRNLTPEGREQAAYLAKMITDAKVPIGDVLSSPFCRAKDTAQLLFGRAPTIDAALIGDTPAAQKRLKTLLTTPPPAGKNTVIISHQQGMANTTGMDLVRFDEGYTMVLRPKPDGTFEVLANLEPGDWGPLVEAGKRLP